MSINRNFEKIADNATEKFNNSCEAIEKNSKDWWHYVEKHPLQSMFFGVIGYFAIKGIFTKGLFKK